MSVSLVQVSKVAGVSKSTVSRVINEDPRVAAETVQLVQSTIFKLGYTRPENMGRPRRDRNGATKGSVALLFPDDNTHAMKTALSGRLMHGMEDLLKKRGLSLIVTSMPSANSLPTCIENRQVDGVILRGTNRPNHISLLENAAVKCPVVYIFEPQTRVPGYWDVVCEDNDAIAAAAFDYFKKRQRTRLAVINPQAAHPSLVHRTKVFVELANQHMGGCRVMQADRPVDAMMEELFDSKPGSSAHPDGLFVPGIDDVVGSVFKWLAARNLLDSKDLDVMACQDDPHRFSLIRQQNDYIDTNAEAIGRAAVETFLWRLQNPKEPQRKLAIEPVLVTADFGAGG